PHPQSLGAVRRIHLKVDVLARVVGKVAPDLAAGRLTQDRGSERSRTPYLELLALVFEVDRVGADAPRPDAGLERLQHAPCRRGPRQRLERGATLKAGFAAGVQHVAVRRGLQHPPAAQEVPPPARAPRPDLFLAIEHGIDDSVLAVPEAYRVAG